MSTQGETKAARKPLLSPSTRENLRIYKYKFSRNKLSVFGLVLVLLSFFFAIFAEVIVPHPESIGSFVDYANASLPPCKDYLFGTDQMGRDVFSRVIFSFRGALIMSIVVLAISVPVGTVLGLLAGYYHGTKIDAVIMRISDVFLSVPSLILALCSFDSGTEHDELHARSNNYVVAVVYTTCIQPGIIYFGRILC